MLTIIEVVVVTALVVVHTNHLALDRIDEVLSLDEHVRAQHDLVLLGDEGSLHEAITSFKTHVKGRLEYKVARQHAVSYCLVKFV